MITREELNFASWCKAMCPPGKGCRQRKQAKSETSWLELKATCSVLKKINKRLNDNLI